MLTDLLRLGARPVRRPSAVDVLVVLGASSVSILSTGRWTGAEPVLLLGAVIVLAAAVLVRRRAPVVVLLVCLAVAVPIVAATTVTPAILVFAEIAVMTVAAQTDRRCTVFAAMITAVLTYLTTVVHTDFQWTQAQPIGIIAWTLLFAAVGDTNRNRRGYIQAIEERARRAESERDVEAARQVAEERLRIARELHDVLAHHVAVIGVHAQLAQVSVRRAPEVAEQSLGHVKDAAGDVLNELGALVRVLRPADETSPAEADPPTPGMAQVDELIEVYRRAGTEVTVTVTGAPAALPPAEDLTAYRVLQEALTNATKHGVPGTTTVTIDHRPDRMELTIRNQIDTGPGVGTGLGILGMRERTASVAGALRVESEEGRFTVRLLLDLPDRSHS